MITKHIHEMTVAEFGPRLRPIMMYGFLFPMDDCGDKLAWLASVWRREERKAIFRVFWGNDLLNDLLHPEARQYQFTDLELREPALALGLDVTCEADMGKLTALMGTCKAWYCAVMAHCRDCAARGLPEQLSPSVLADFVRITCNWMLHSWVQESVRRYLDIQSKSLKLTQAQQADNQTETLRNPLWPDAIVIHAKHYEPSQGEIDHALSEESKIRYWIDHFTCENGKYSSQYDLKAWDVRDDIDTAKRKIEGLKELVNKQEALIPGLERAWLKYKRLDAKVTGSSKSGRPKQHPKMQEVARKFTVQWVQSLMEVLHANNAADLEKMVSEISQRNWRRWMMGQSVPTQSTLTQLRICRITTGPLKGLRFHEVKTTPTGDELFDLIRLASKTSKAPE